LGKKNSYNLGKRNGMKDDDIGMTAAADGYTEIDPSQQEGEGEDGRGKSEE